MERWKEPMLEPREREAAILAILDQGLVPRPGLGELLHSALNAQVLFFGVVDCIFLSILAGILLIIPLLIAVLQQASPAPMLFLASPALYALLLGLTAWKESQSGLLEWKRSCRLSLQTVSALRMAVFGGGSILVCVPVNLWLWNALGRELPLSWMLGVSLSSLFLYGLLSLACLEGMGRGRLAAPPAIWTALGGLLLAWDGASAWLTALPGAVFLVVAGAALALYLLELKRFCLGRRRGESYAVG